MKKTLNLYRPMILSRHPTHSPLRSKNKTLPLFKKRVIIRFGSTTELTRFNINLDNVVEINKAEAIKNSSNKIRMKKCFDEANVKSAKWCVGMPNDFRFPVIGKLINGSRGRGIKLFNTIEQIEEFLNNDNIKNYLFEEYFSGVREYRLHVTKEGCFYSCRKMLKKDTPDDQRFFKNDSNCVWILEDNPAFEKPLNWDQIVEECVKALNATGLDFGAVDLRVSSNKDKEGNIVQNPNFMVIEINSAPSFGEITLKKYIEILPKLITNKINNNE